MITEIQNRIIAQTWTGGSDVVFPTGSVLITPNLEEGLRAALNQAGLRTPICLIAPEAAESDPEYDEEPDLQKFAFTVMLCVTIPGGAIGQETLMSANVPDSTKSEGQGILTVEQEFFNAVGKLNALENVVIQNIQRSEQGGAFHPPGTYISYRTYRLEAWGTTTSSASSSSTTFTTVKQTGNQTATDGVLANLAGLSFSVTAGTTYVFQFNVIYATTVSTIGLQLGLTFPASTTFAATVKIPQGASGTSSEFQGAITASGGSVTAAATPTATDTYIATVEGTITPSSSGTLQAQFAAESAGATITAYAASSGFLYTLA